MMPQKYLNPIIRTLFKDIFTDVSDEYNIKAEITGFEYENTDQHKNIVRAISNIKLPQHSSAFVWYESVFKNLLQRFITYYKEETNKNIVIYTHSNKPGLFGGFDKNHGPYIIVEMFAEKQTGDFYLNLYKKKSYLE